MTKVPNLRFPEFTEEWETKKLGEILEFKNGINATKEQYGSGYKFINVLDILNNEFITHDKIIGSVNVNEEIIDKFPVNYGDILFQRSSETREEVGTTSVYLDKDKTATFGGFVIRGKKIGEYEPIFLNKSLKTDLVRNQITSKSGGSTRYNIGQEILASVTLHFPSLNEQTKIASFLSLIDSRIQTQNKIIKELEILIQELRNQIFKRKRRFTDTDGRDFAGWKKVKIGDILKIGNGKDYKHLQSGDIPVFGTGGFMTLVNDYLYDGETVCIGRKGTIDKPMYHEGKLWTVDTLFYTHSFQSCIPKFIFHLFQTINWLEYNEASGVPSLSKTTIEKIGLQIPSIEEQERIASFLNKIDHKIQTEKAILEQLEMQKKYLLKQMFV